MNQDPKYYLIYIINPVTKKLMFNIELKGNEVIVNYGEGVTPNESAKLFFDHLVHIITGDTDNLPVQHFKNSQDKPA